MAVTFPRRDGPPRRYEDTLLSYRCGLLTCGFLWALAAHDDVFGALLRRLKIPTE